MPLWNGSWLRDISRSPRWWWRNASSVRSLVCWRGILFRVGLGHDHGFGEFSGDVAAEQIAAAGTWLSVVRLQRTVGEHLHGLVAGRARLSIDLKHIVG